VRPNGSDNCGPALSFVVRTLRTQSPFMAIFRHVWNCMASGSFIQKKLQKIDTAKTNKKWFSR
jgi:hypothetical protein